MQTNLCSVDFEVLFWTRSTAEIFVTWRQRVWRMIYDAKRYVCRSFEELVNASYINYALF